jgi:hypothetical protein
MARIHHLRRCAAVVTIGAYLLLTAFYLGRHALGDSPGGPFAYFWTWDMFPNYPTESVRRLAIGETADGSFVTLVPKSTQQFRWGVHNDVTRFDIDRRLPILRQAAADLARDYNASTTSNSIRNIYLADKYWPPKYNLPQPLYQDFYTDEVTGSIYWSGSSNAASQSHPVYWRLIEEVTNETNGGLVGRESRP